MATESEVKKMVKEFLKKELNLVPLGTDPHKALEQGAKGFWWMPVPSGYGVSYLDFIGHYRGFFFGIETKKDPTKKPTPKQQQAIDLTDLTAAAAFLVRSEEDLNELRDWRRVIDILLF